MALMEARICRICSRGPPLDAWWSRVKTLLNALDLEAADTVVK